MREIAKPMLKNQYGQYLSKVIDEMKESINSRTIAKKYGTAQNNTVTENFGSPW